MFSKLDANSGFWQVKLHPDSMLLTTFITPWGRYCFRRMPFGISSAPEYFQRCMEKILHGLTGVLCLMDDVLIYGRTPGEHWKRLRAVLKRIENAGMTLEKKKCEFGKNEIKFLGHLISSDGIRPDPDKVKAILDVKPPANKTEARRFTGMINYLSKFSSKIAELCTPIYAVTGSRSEWYWDKRQQLAFDSIKKELVKAPVLCSFDMNRTHRVSADASKEAIGAVLLQLDENGIGQPVEYASRKMTESEKRYAMIEKEALAITWACEKFDYYLIGRPFQIETDHKPLIPLLGEKDLSQLPIRVQRFRLRLLRYDYEIFHTPGDKMYLADSLSRPNSGDTSSIDTISSVEMQLYVNAVVGHSTSFVHRQEELHNAMCNDRVCKQTVDYIVNGWPSTNKRLEGEMVSLFACRNQLTLCQNVIFYDSRVYIPRSLWKSYLKYCHEGHQGITKCRRRAQRHFWWPGVGADIADFVNTCNVCIRQTAIRHQPMTERELPPRPWHTIASDVLYDRAELDCASRNNDSGDDRVETDYRTPDDFTVPTVADALDHSAEARERTDAAELDTLDNSVDVQDAGSDDDGQDAPSATVPELSDNYSEPTDDQGVIGVREEVVTTTRSGRQVKHLRDSHMYYY